MKFKRVLALALAGLMTVTSVPMSGLGSIQVMAAETAAEDADTKVYTAKNLTDGKISQADLAFINGMDNFEVTVVYRLTNTNQSANKRYALLTLAGANGKQFTVVHDPQVTASVGSIHYEYNGCTGMKFSGGNFKMTDTNWHKMTFSLNSAKKMNIIYDGDKTLANNWDASGKWQVNFLNGNNDYTEVFVGKKAPNGTYSSGNKVPDMGAIEDFPGEIKYIKIANKSYTNTTLEQEFTNATDLQTAKTEYTEALAACTGLTQSDYTPDSWTAFNTAKTAAVIADSAMATTKETGFYTAADALKTAKASLVPVGATDNREAIPVPELSMTAPVEGAKPADVRIGVDSTDNTGISDRADNPANFQTDYFTIMEENAGTNDSFYSIKGQLIANKNVEHKGKFNITGTKPFAISFRVFAESVPADGKISGIIGKMDNQYGVQMSTEGSTTYLSLYSAGEGNNWTKQQNYSLVFKDGTNDLTNQWIDVLACYNGDKFSMFAKKADGTVVKAVKKGNGVENGLKLPQDDNSNFSIGYNAAKPEHPIFDGKLANVKMYAGASEGDTTFPNAETVTGANDAEKFAAMQTALQAKTPMFNLHLEKKDGQKPSVPYTVATEWKKGTAVMPTTEAFAKGNTYTVKATLTAIDTAKNKFDASSKPTRIYIDGAWVNLDTSKVTVAADGNTMTIEHSFTLEDTSSECQCTLSEITGFEGGTISMGVEEQATKTLEPECTASRGNCAQHQTVPAVNKVFTLDSNSADATIDDNGVLTVKKPGSVTVKVTFTLAGTTQKKEKSVTFEVTSDRATDEQRQKLQDAVDAAELLKEAEYTADTWKDVKAALDEGKTVLANEKASGKEVEDATSNLTDAVSKLVNAPTDNTDKDLAAARDDANKALKEAEPIIQGGKADYTDATWTAFSNAYNTLKNTVADANATAAALRAQTAALRSAQAGLAKKPAELPRLPIGSIQKSGNFFYKVTGKDTATVQKLTPKGAKAGKITIYNQVTLAGAPYKVTAIANNAFKNNKKMTSVVLGLNITKIGNGAFAGCKKLKKVTVKGKVTNIGSKAFNGDTKLKSIQIKSKKIKKFGAGAFKGIDKKAVVKVPKAKLKAYTKLIKKAGLPKTAKIKK